MNELLDKIFEEISSWQDQVRPASDQDAIQWVRAVWDRLSIHGEISDKAVNNIYFSKILVPKYGDIPQCVLDVANENQRARDALVSACAQALRKGSFPKKSPKLSNWLADILTGKAKTPKNYQRRPTKVFETLLIKAIVDQLVRWGWTATRNEASTTVSACDIVGLALKKTPGHIKKLHEKKLSNLPQILSFDFFASSIDRGA